MILGVSEKKDMSEACARFISWTQFGPLGLFGPLNAKQNLLRMFWRWVSIYAYIIDEPLIQTALFKHCAQCHHDSLNPDIESNNVAPVSANPSL